jgi:hypothetical protein
MKRQTPHPTPPPTHTPLHATHTHTHAHTRTHTHTHPRSSVADTRDAPRERQLRDARANVLGGCAHYTLYNTLIGAGGRSRSTWSDTGDRTAGGRESGHPAGGRRAAAAPLCGTTVVAAVGDRATLRLDTLPSSPAAPALLP